MVNKNLCQIGQRIAQLAETANRQNFKDNLKFVYAILHLCYLGGQLYQGQDPNTMDIISSIEDFKTIYQYITKIVKV